MVVPVQTVIGTISMGANRHCFVIGADGQPELRDVAVGMSNQRLVEIKSGLKVGDQVVLNPMSLLSEDSEMKQGKVKKRSDDDDGQGPGGEEGKKGKKKKKSGGPPGVVPGDPPVPNPGANPGIKGFGAGPPTEEQKQAWAEKMGAMTPAQRREMINAIPDAAVRDRVLQKMRDQGLTVAD
jgi:HlyD family secretion protein